MSLVIDDVLVRHDPVGESVPVVFDSPHSGCRYPDEFGFTCPLPLLRQAEDAHVDTLFGFVPEFGATLITALFPRSFIDPNRAPDDIHPDLLDGPWPGPLNPTEKSQLGMGLVRHLCRTNLPMYDGRLPVAAVMDRIERYWRPYHGALAAAMDGLHRAFGSVWHINCHSMPSLPVGRDGVRGADFVLGDRDGTTCVPEFTQLVGDTLRDLGYRVAVNDPYKGVELVRRHSDPQHGRHSLQLEIDRRLYMDEETLEPHEGFERLRVDLGILVRRICDHAGAGATRLAAE